MNAAPVPRDRIAMSGGSLRRRRCALAIELAASLYLLKDANFSTTWVKQNTFEGV